MIKNEVMALASAWECLIVELSMLNVLNHKMRLRKRLHAISHHYTLILMYFSQAVGKF